MITTSATTILQGTPLGLSDSTVTSLRENSTDLVNRQEFWPGSLTCKPSGQSAWEILAALQQTLLFSKVA